MKRSIPSLLSASLFILFTGTGQAQTELAPDQNPNFAVSRDKYIKIADSINSWHSTTQHETYKAIDYLADKREARDARRAFRRELRLVRAANGWYYNDNYSFPLYNNYRRHNTYYGPYNRYYVPNWNRHNRNNFLWNTLPLAITLGLLCR